MLTQVTLGQLLVTAWYTVAGAITSQMLEQGALGRLLLTSYCLHGTR